MAHVDSTVRRLIGLPSLRAAEVALLLAAGVACQRPAPPPEPEGDPTSGSTSGPGQPTAERPAPAPPASTHGGEPDGLAPKEPQGSQGRPFAGTAGRSERPPGDADVGQLIGVRAARHGGFDRVVFEFSDHVPGYTIEYIDRPVRACGSGHVVPLLGDGWLQVQLSPARAHTDEGKPTVAQRRVQVNSTTLLEFASTCDFEGYVTWVLGVRSPNRYRVLELDAPPRLAVDVLH